MTQSFLQFFRPWSRCLQVGVCLPLILYCQFANAQSQNPTVNPAYGAYGHYPIGSIRVLAMGGAFAGLADDASAVMFNPAGLAISKSIFDFSSGENNITNRESRFLSASSATGLPYLSKFRAISTRLGPIGIGAGQSNLYSLDYDRGGTSPYHRILRIDNTDFAVAINLFKIASLGATLHSENVTVAFRNWNGSEPTANLVRQYPSIGVMAGTPRKWGLGVMYSPQRFYDVDEGLDALITEPGGEWFHDVVIPAKVTLGSSYASSPRLRWVGDIDIYFPVHNAIPVGGSRFDFFNRISSQQQTVWHGGYEYSVLNTKQIEFIWRGGGYLEPSRLPYSATRFHYTMGIEFRFHFLVFAASYDQAPGFSNIAQSVGVSLGDI